jgi:predicted small lipoprotein YifL
MTGTSDRGTTADPERPGPDVRATTLALAALLAALTACGTEEPPPAGQDDPGVSQDSPETDTELDESLPMVPVDQALVEAGGEFDVDPEQIEVLVAEEVTWPDGAIGCPEPGEMYTQALVEGYRIVLDVDGEEVHYHGARDQPPFRCEDPQEPAEGGERS